MIKSSNDIAWEALFKKYDILNQIDDHGQFIISAGKIKEYREPRLMAKFDHNINLPQIFANNQLAILPISRGDYVISHFEAYKQFETHTDATTHVSLPSHIRSLDPKNISSEATAINCAFASGMIDDFLDEGGLISTVSGRMGSGRFDFYIRNSKTGKMSRIEVNRSQIEIDAAFEGIKTLSLFEAKMDLSPDFLIRQLYYPFKVWQNRVSKKVRPIFLVYSNGIFNLYEYEFQNPDLYNSLVLIKHKKYSIEDTDIKLSDLQDVMAQISVFIPEPKISFPQADSFQRVINICELLESQELNRDDVTETYAFDARQTNYYTDAACYLGLIGKRTDDRKPVYFLSKKGKRTMELSYKPRQLEFCKCILEHKVFYDVFNLSCQMGRIPETTEIVKIMKRSRLYNIKAESTYKRRASTINGWINWMLSLRNE